jgi:hypothetical protein
MVSKDTTPITNCFKLVSLNFESNFFLLHLYCFAFSVYKIDKPRRSERATKPNPKYSEVHSIVKCNEVQA